MRTLGDKVRPLDERNLVLVLGYAALINGFFKDLGLHRTRNLLAGDDISADLGRDDEDWLRRCSGETPDFPVELGGGEDTVDVEPVFRLLGGQREAGPEHGCGVGWGYVERQFLGGNMVGCV